MWIIYRTFTLLFSYRNNREMLLLRKRQKLYCLIHPARSIRDQNLWWSIRQYQSYILQCTVFVSFTSRYLKNVSVEGDQGKPNVEFTQDGVLKAAQLKIMNLRPGVSKQLVWEEVSPSYFACTLPAAKPFCRAGSCDTSFANKHVRTDEELTQRVRGTGRLDRLEN